MKYGSFKYGSKKYGYGDIHFVYDRTIADMENQTQKSFLNYNDLNRIEKNLISCADLLNENIISKIDWKEGDFILLETFERLTNTLKMLYNKAKPYINNDIVLSYNDFEQINYSSLNHFEKTILAIYKGGIKFGS